MRKVVVLDDALVEAAMAYAGTRSLNELVNDALLALVEREAARRLAALGGSDPGANAGSRYRSQP